MTRTTLNESRAAALFSQRFVRSVNVILAAVKSNKLTRWSIIIVFTRSGEFDQIIAVRKSFGYQRECLTSKLYNQFRIEDSLMLICAFCLRYSQSREWPTVSESIFQIPFKCTESVRSTIISAQIFRKFQRIIDLTDCRTRVRLLRMEIFKKRSGII